MKKIIILFLITSLSHCQIIKLNAQSIHRSVIGSAGTVSTVGNLTLSSTIGEAITSTLSNANVKITQGFQQGSRVVNVPLYFILYLQGYYVTGTNLMQPVLFNQGKSSDISLVDTLDIELHAATFPYQVVASNKVLLTTNALVNSSIVTKPGNYYIVIKHRNTVETWTPIPYAFNGAPILIDFSYQAQNVYGSNQVEVDAGVWAFYTGDVNHDDNVDLLDIGVVETDVDQFLFGYYATDINGDGNVDLLDVPAVENNVNAFVFAEHP